ncbi:hypothetical protein GCM10009565_06770 [Amycolatopsis albidoflavus]
MGFRLGLGRVAGFRFLRIRLGRGGRTGRRTLLGSGGPVRIPAGIGCLVRNWTGRAWLARADRGWRVLAGSRSRIPARPRNGALVLTRRRCRCLTSTGWLAPMPLGRGRPVKTLAGTNRASSECPARRGDGLLGRSPRGSRWAAPSLRRCRADPNLTDSECPVRQGDGLPGRSPRGNPWAAPSLRRCRADPTPTDSARPAQEGDARQGRSPLGKRWQANRRQGRCREGPIQTASEHQVDERPLGHR